MSLLLTKSCKYPIIKGPLTRRFSMDANRWIDLNAHKTLERSFFVGSWCWTAVSFIAFVMAFNKYLTVDQFGIINNLYWPTVLLYATTRKISRALKPEETPHRWGEFFLVFWMAVALVGMGITISFMREMFPLMKELGMLYIILLGILIGGKAVEKTLEAIFPKK